MYAGAFASRNPRSALVAGGGFFRAADPDGLYMARFGWADPNTGFAHSERVAGALLGFVQPIAGFRRQLVLPTRSGVLIRPGYQVTLFSTGDFFARFAGGATLGQPVYASILDGNAISGEADDAERTPWTVIQGCGPGGLAIISTWSNFQ
jgi:hypothetical protein